MRFVVISLLTLIICCKNVDKEKQVKLLFEKCKYEPAETDKINFSNFEFEFLDCNSETFIDSVLLGFTMNDAEHKIDDVINSTKNKFMKKGNKYILPKESLFENIPLNRYYDIDILRKMYLYKKIKIDTLISKYKIYLMKYEEVKFIDKYGNIHYPAPE